MNSAISPCAYWPNNEESDTRSCLQKNPIIHSLRTMQVRWRGRPVLTRAASFWCSTSAPLHRAALRISQSLLLKWPCRLWQFSLRGCRLSAMMMLKEHEWPVPYWVCPHERSQQGNRRPVLFFCDFRLDLAPLQTQSHQIDVNVDVISLVGIFHMREKNCIFCVGVHFCARMNVRRLKRQEDTSADWSPLQRVTLLESVWIQ